METNSTIAPPRRLYKSRRNRMIDGICGGVAEYFDVDPTIVRILWVILCLSAGSGFFLYIAAMIIMPVNPEHIGQTEGAPVPNGRPDRKRFWGVIVMLLGIFLLLSNLGLMAEFGWWSFSGKVIFPVLLILGGIILIYSYSRRSRDPQPADFLASDPSVQPPPKRELRRSVRERKLFGVCGGFAEYLGIDPTIVRILYLVLVIASFGWGLLLYIILALLMPEERPKTT